jgi:hypothetical protein
MATPWRFYVYELSSSDGIVQYVGKGSGGRLAAQIKSIGFHGREIARFKKEADAYAYEIERIAQVEPLLNKCKGGNGNRAAAPKRVVKTSWEKEYERIGSRVMAARLWLAAATASPHMADISKVDEIRRVAYG